MDSLLFRFSMHGVYMEQSQISNESTACTGNKKGFIINTGSTACFNGVVNVKVVALGLLSLCDQSCESNVEKQIKGHVVIYSTPHLLYSSLDLVFQMHIAP